MQIGIIDYGDQNYGSGNLNSVQNSLSYSGIKSQIISDPKKLYNVDKIILPGVGASSHVMKCLKKKEFDLVLNELVIKNCMPFLGICVGMQVLASNLTEFENHKGLGWVDAKVINLKSKLSKEDIVPHTCWNKIFINENSVSLRKSLEKHNNFYFSHSYTMVPTDKSVINSSFVYGNKEFVAGVMIKNIVAFQFHPEKSQIAGQKLLRWYANWHP